MNNNYDMNNINNHIDYHINNNNYDMNNINNHIDYHINNNYHIDYHINNNYIRSEYNIIYHNVIYNRQYNNSLTMVRNNINQIYNNSEEFMQEQERMRQLQEYENELRREQELRLQEMTELYINQFSSVTQINDIETFTQEIIEIEDDENLDDGELDNERNDTYLQNGEELIETCSICLDDVVDIESISKLSCGHHFHTNCIKLCLERSRKCPLCRKYCLRNY